MIVQKFLRWSTGATPTQRADGASALARAYLFAAVGADERHDIELALTRLLDDRSSLVRRALAEVFAGTSEAPAHIVLALAEDQSDVSAGVLARSPLLADDVLVDCAAVGDTYAQAAIASRTHVSATVAAALGAIGAREALVTLAANAGASLSDATALHMLDRFGEDPFLREALLGREGLGSGVRCRLVDATATVLARFAVERGWLSTERADRLGRDAREQAHVTIAADGRTCLHALVAHLRGAGQLSAALLLRSLLCGRTDLFGAALGSLAGADADRVTALLRDWRSSAFAALYRRAGLPLNLLPGFRAVLAAVDQVPHPRAGVPHRGLVDAAIARCDAANFDGALDTMSAILRRIRVEALRAEARSAAEPPLAPAAPEPLLLVDPDRDPRLVGRRSDHLGSAPRFTIDFTALEAELLAA